MWKNFRQNIHSELLKIFCSRSFKIVALLIIIIQGIIAFISAQQILSVGLDATPETCHGLLEPMPPIEYMGFDVVMLSTIPMIVLGSIWGSAEFKHHCLRTSLLSYGNKNSLFAAKTTAVIIISFMLSIISVIICITITHFTFGNEGLVPILFNVQVWKFIILAIVAVALLTIVSYAIGFLFRTAVVPMLFLIIQAYNIGDMLAEHFELCKLLPVSLANRLIASSESMLTSHPVQNIFGLLVWIIIVISAGYFIFRKIDLQGEY